MIPVSAEIQNQDLVLGMSLRGREFALPKTTYPGTEFLLPIGESLLVRLQKGPLPDRLLSRPVSCRRGCLDLLTALNNKILMQCLCRTRLILHHLDHPSNPSLWPCDPPVNQQAIQCKPPSPRVLLGV